jgi:hypothetical protein
MDESPTGDASTIATLKRKPAAIHPSVTTLPGRILMTSNCKSQHLPLRDPTPDHYQQLRRIWHGESTVAARPGRAATNMTASGEMEKSSRWYAAPQGVPHSLTIHSR